MYSYRGSENVHSYTQAAALPLQVVNDASFMIRWKAACILLPLEKREAMLSNR
jgi:hypothetical protein